MADGRHNGRLETHAYKQTKQSATTALRERAKETTIMPTRSNVLLF